MERLALLERPFNETEKELATCLIKGWKTFPRNSLNRTYLESALAQRSPNKDFLISVHFEANKRIEWLIVTVLREKGVRTSNLNRILKYYRFNGVVSPYYLKKVKEWYADMKII